MTNPTRKRLKKKVLDRWENEGGSLCDTSPEQIPERGPSSEPEATASAADSVTPATANDHAADDKGPSE